MYESKSLNEEIKEIKDITLEPIQVNETISEVQEQLSPANQFITEYNKDKISLEIFSCNNCHKPPINPQTCKNCQIIYCENCINELIIYTKGKCPSCKEIYTKYPIHYTIKSILSETNLPCINKELGCQTVVNYNEMTEHLKRCNYVINNCPYCNEKIKSKEYDSHLKNCETIEYYCENCKFKSKILNFSSHLSFCDYFKTINENEEKFYNILNSRIDELENKIENNFMELVNQNVKTNDEIENNKNLFNSVKDIILENLRMEINRLDLEIMRTDKEINSNKREVEQIKLNLDEKVENVRKYFELEMIDHKKTTIDDNFKIGEQINSGNEQIKEIKKEISMEDQKISAMIKNIKDDLIKLSQSTQIQINTIKEENKRVIGEIKISKQSSRVEQKNMMEKIEEENTHNKKELLNDMNTVKSQLLQINEEIQKMNDSLTSLKVETYKNKILLEDKFNSNYAEFQADLMKNTELLNVEINHIKNEEIQNFEELVSLKRNVDDLINKLEIMNNEYVLTFKKLLDSMKMEIGSLEKDLMNRTQIFNENRNEIEKLKYNFDETIFNLRQENAEMRKIVNNIIIDMKNTNFEYKDNISEKYIKNDTEKIQVLTSPETEIRDVQIKDNIKINLENKAISEIISTEVNHARVNSKVGITSRILSEPYFYLNKFDKEYVLSTPSQIFSVEYISINSENLLYQIDYLITGHKNGSILIWEIDTFTNVKSFKEHTDIVDDIKSININNNGIFTSCSKDSLIKVWNISKQNSLLTLKNDSWNFCITYLKNFNNSLFAVGDNNKRIKIFNYENGNKFNSIETKHSHGVARLLHIYQLCPYSYLLSSSKNEIKLWNLKDMKLLRNFNEHLGWVNSLLYLKNGIFCSGSDDSIKIWTIKSEKSIRSINIHSSSVSSMLYWNNCEENKEILITGTIGKSSKFIKLGNIEENDIKNYNFLDNVIKTIKRDESIFKMIFIREQTAIASINWMSKNLKILGNFKNEKYNHIDLNL